MALTDGDLVEGNLTEVPELRPGVATAKVALLDVLGDVSTYPQVVGHLGDGHAPQ